MATVNDIGVPGQPATNLTAWQAAVRDAINGRAAAQLTGHATTTAAGSLIRWKTGATSGGGVTVDPAAGTITVPTGWWHIGFIVNASAVANLGVRVWNGTAWVPHLVAAQARGGTMLYRATAATAFGLFLDAGGGLADDTAASSFHVHRLAP